MLTFLLSLYKPLIASCGDAARLLYSPRPLLVTSRSQLAGGWRGICWGGFWAEGACFLHLGSGVLPQTCFHVRCLLPNSFSSFLLVPLQYLVTIERMTKSSWEHILLNISNTWTRLRDRVDLEFTHVDLCTSKSLAGQREVMYTLMGEGALVVSWTQILNILDKGHRIYIKRGGIVELNI